MVRGIGVVIGLGIGLGKGLGIGLAIELGIVLRTVLARVSGLVFSNNRIESEKVDVKHVWEISETVKYRGKQLIALTRKCRLWLTV